MNPDSKMEGLDILFRQRDRYWMALRDVLHIVGTTPNIMYDDDPCSSEEYGKVLCAIEKIILDAQLELGDK